MPLAWKGPNLATSSVPSRGPGAHGKSYRVVKFPLRLACPAPVDGPVCAADSLLLLTLKALWGYKLVCGAGWGGGWDLEKTEEQVSFQGSRLRGSRACPFQPQADTLQAGGTGAGPRAYLHYVLVNVLGVPVHQVDLLEVNVLDDLGLQVCVLLGHHRGAG